MSVFKKQVVKLLNSNKSSLSKLPSISARDYVKQHLPEVYNEMMADPLYASWLNNSFKANLVVTLTDGDKKVGYCTYGASKDTKGIVLVHAYILKEYRGKEIFVKHLRKVMDITLAEHGMIIIDQANHYIVQSLVKGNLAIEIPNTDLIMTIIPITDNNHQLTNLYEKNLLRPILIDNGSTFHLGRLQDIDTIYLLNQYGTLIEPSEEYMENLVNTVSNLKNEVMQMCNKHFGEGYDYDSIFVRT